MNKTIAIAAIALLSCLSAFSQESVTSSEQEMVMPSEQVSPTINTETTNELNPAVFSNSYILSLNAAETDDPQSVVVNQSYKQNSEYRTGRTMRGFGIAMTAVGGAWTGFWGAAALSCAASSSDGLGDLGTAVLGWYAVAGLPVLGSGIALWICGQHKMNKVKAASNGAGLAFNF